MGVQDDFSPFLQFILCHKVAGIFCARRIKIGRVKFMKGFKKSAVFFAIGGVGYAIIELIWRRRTHWTMIIAGGICFVIFSHIAERFGSRPLVFKAALAALGVTLVELIFGVLFNIIFNQHHQVNHVSIILNEKKIVSKKLNNLP